MIAILSQQSNRNGYQHDRAFEFVSFQTRMRSCASGGKEVLPSIARDATRVVSMKQRCGAARPQSDSKRMAKNSQQPKIVTVKPGANSLKQPQKEL
jgi:hypothetical protein